MLNTVPATPWLFPEEQAEVVQNLLEFKLLKYDNQRSLPLKMGGTTDIYINLRDARNDPRAINFVTQLFQIPLRRLRPDRFVEVPDSVSCFAGPLSMSLGIPYMTIRGEAKEGRVSNAKIIGQPNRGEVVCTIDDVITNGDSKIVPHLQCEKLGLFNEALVVLVDRQQGWQEHLAKNGIQMHVWPGMTLHRVRLQLIQNLGVMQRCSPELEKNNPMIVALDGKNWEELLPLLDQLRTTGCILKVNDLLFEQGIAHLLPDLSVYGRVMVDLKCHDIPNTVENTCRRLRPHNPWAVTVHASGGEKMVHDAVKALEGTDTKVLAVTVLTSIDKVSGDEIYHRLPIEQVKTLAAIAHRAGAHGFVCSPEEVRELRQIYSNATLVTPGLRSAGVDAGDQQRIATPQAAWNNGSNYLVMGRQILNASDPVAEVWRVIQDELGLRLQ